MALNKRRVSRSRQRSSRQQSDFFRLKDGRNIIRVFTFLHVVDKTDFKRGIYMQSDGIKEGEEYDEIEREVARHFTGDGIVNCPGADCKWCDEAQDLLKSKNKQDQKAGKQLSSSVAYYVNLVDMEDADKGIQIGSLPSTVFNAIINYASDPEFGEDILGPEGRDFIIDRDKNQTPQNMYSVKIRDAKRCEELPEDLKEKVTDLFNMSALEPGWSSNDDLNSYENEDEDNDKVDKERNRRSTRRGKKDDGDNDFKDEDKDDKPKSNRRRKDDDEGDGDPPPPWEKDKDDDKGKDEGPSFEVGDKVEFEDDGDTFSGKIEEINDGVAAVKVPKEGTFDIPVGELREPKKSGRRR